MNLFLQKLRSTGTLGTVEETEIELLTSRSRSFLGGRDLIREGDETGPMFVILKGWACRYKILPNGMRQIMAFLIPGDACDLHMNLLSEMDHGIQAITTVEVAMVSRQDADQLMSEFPLIARAMYIAQLIDEGTMRAWIVSMGRRNSLERVAHLICELVLRMQTNGINTQGSFALPLSQVILSDALGMTPVHINRVFKELRVVKALTINRGHIEILDQARLVNIAGFDENYLHRRILRNDRRFA